MKLAIKVVSGLLLPLAAGSAFAVPISGTSYDSSCTVPDGTVLSGSNSACNLQNLLNAMAQDGASDINVQTDQSYAELFATTSTGTSSQLILEIAGWANGNTFGIYDPNAPGTMIELYAGGASGPASLANLRQIYIDTADSNLVYVNFGSTGVNWSGTTFGFYLDPQQGSILYSEAALNGGFDAMVGFWGTGELYNFTGNGDEIFGAGQMLLGWEDTRNGDGDYQDMLIRVESAFPVPEPATLALFGLGLAGFGFARRRKV